MDISCNSIPFLNLQSCWLVGLWAGQKEIPIPDNYPDLIFRADRKGILKFMLRFLTTWIRFVLKKGEKGSWFFAT